jgi:hypothetical protein
MKRSFLLGLIYDRDNENQKALFWYKKASQKGYKKAKERLAFLQEWLKNKQNVGGRYGKYIYISQLKRQRHNKGDL